MIRSRWTGSRYGGATSAPHWITVDKGVLMIHPRRRALPIVAAVLGLALLIAGVVVLVQATVVDVRLARLVVFAALTVLVTLLVVGFAVVFARRGGRMRLH